MEQNLIFGLVLGQLAVLKKTFGADYEQLLRAIFSCFHGEKPQNTVVSACFLFEFFLNSFKFWLKEKKDRTGQQIKS